MNDSYLRNFKLQHKIEGLSNQFDVEKNIHQMMPELINMLIKKDEVCAREYIRNNPKKVDNEDLNGLTYFDLYTLEALMLNALTHFFNSACESAVRVSTLIDYLNDLVKDHMLSKIRSKKRSLKVNKEAILSTSQSLDYHMHDEMEKALLNKESSFVIGAKLVEFLVDRKLIVLSNDLGFQKQYAVPNQGNDGYHIKKTMYAICNFDTSLLPIKHNLPMVSIPAPWEKISTMRDTCYISDLRGGYLAKPSGHYYNRFRLLTSRDNDNFHIEINDEESVEKLCHSMTVLQNEALEINSDVLQFIQCNKKDLEEVGMLSPSILAKLNVVEALKMLRNDFQFSSLESEYKCRFDELVSDFMKLHQRARYESFVIELATAYEGYRIYLPAFIDFRGRIYRSGLLHFA